MEKRETKGSLQLYLQFLEALPKDAKTHNAMIKGGFSISLTLSFLLLEFHVAS